jgi:hypothetical protein
MKQLPGISFFSLCCTMVMLALSSVGATDADVQSELNNYYVELDATFARIAESGALRSTNMRQAERLFVREMRKNMAFNTFYRTNSKGSIISEVVRSQKIERPMRDVSDQRWFRRVSNRKEAYYTLIKDDERGRYYLFWARPILKRGDRFVGAVVTKIDLWDSFYEFSNSVYYPFLIKLGRKSLFSHKWKEGVTGTTRKLTIQGIAQISVTYAGPVENIQKNIMEKETKPDTGSATFAVADTVMKDTTSPDTAAAKKKKKGGSGLLTFFLVILIIGIVAASIMLIAWMRRRAFLKRLDEEDNDLL